MMRAHLDQWTCRMSYVLFRYFSKEKAVVQEISDRGSLELVRNSLSELAP